MLFRHRGVLRQAAQERHHQRERGCTLDEAPLHRSPVPIPYGFQEVDIQVGSEQQQPCHGSHAVNRDVGHRRVQAGGGRYMAVRKDRPHQKCRRQQPDHFVEAGRCLPCQSASLQWHQVVHAWRRQDREGRGAWAAQEWHQQTSGVLWHLHYPWRMRFASRSGVSVDCGA